MLQKFNDNTQTISHLIKPMRKQMLVEELIKEQNFTGADKSILASLIEEATIEERLEGLLAMS